MTLVVPQCVRSAWLVLGSQTLQLDAPALGWSCESLDLGSPVVRTVMNDRPDADGVTDRSQFMGARTVVASVHAIAPIGRIDAIASSFAPYMVPSARPVLHYVLDRPGAAERTLVLRPDAYDWPIVGAVERVITLQWIAAEPVARDVTVQTTTAWAGSSTTGGRLYNLSYPRIYPSGGASAVSGRVLSNGDVPIRPMVRIYGPVTQPIVIFHTAQSGQQFELYFQPTARIDAGHRVDVDCAAHTAYYDGDPTQNCLGWLDWSNSQWPVLPVAPDSTSVVMQGQVATGVTQTQVSWRDGYLS